MYKLVVVAVMAVILCWSATSCAFPDSTVLHVFTFRVDNSKPEAIGYINNHSGPEPDWDIAIQSIYLDGNQAFLVDQYHGNVKRIDLLTGQMISSDKVSTRPYPWIRDVAVFHDKVYVSDDFDSIFVFNKDLSRALAFSICSRSPKFFIAITPQMLDVYVQLKDTIAHIDTMNQIVGYEDGHLYPYDLAHGKKYEICTKNGKQYFKADNIDLELTKPIPDLTCCYDAINVDFNSRYLVYFDANEKEFTLYVYSLTGKE